MGTIDYLDALRVRLGVHSDNALSKQLGVTRNCISNYRHGRSSLDPAIALKVADLLGHDRAAVYLDIEAERARKTNNTAALHVIEELQRRLAA